MPATPPRGPSGSQDGVAIFIQSDLNIFFLPSGSESENTFPKYVNIEMISNVVAHTISET